MCRAAAASALEGDWGPSKDVEKDLIPWLASPKTNRFERSWGKDPVNHETHGEFYQAGRAALRKARPNRFWHLP